MVNKFHKLKKESTKANLHNKIPITRNSVLTNSFLTERNNFNCSIKNTPNILTSKKQSKYKKIFRKSNFLTAKRDKTTTFFGLNMSRNKKCINIRGSYNKKISIKNYRNVITKMRLFNENKTSKLNKNESNTMDIKSYETNFITPSTSEIQEQKLIILSSSLLSLTQNDELLTKNNLGEKLESNIEYIIEFLSIKDLFNLALSNKELYKIIIKYFLDKIEIKIDEIKEKINDIIIKSKGYIKLKEKEFKKLETNIFDERAMNLMGTISKKKLFKEKSSLMNNNDAILLFEIFFVSIGQKFDLLEFDTNDKNMNIKRWNYFCNYFNCNESTYLKNIVEKNLVNKKLSNEVINSLYECSNKFMNRINPHHFQIINKDLAIFSYIIKDLLDYFGISMEKKVDLQKLYILHTVRLSVNEKIFSKLNQILNKI